MKTKNGRALVLMNIILPIIVIVGMAALLLQNYLYNNKERVYQLADAERTETEFVFDDITIKLAPRAGDSGSWGSNYLKDKNGTLIYLNAIGTIYEAEVINTSQDTVTDWTFRLDIPEEMYVNNTWNGDFEYHQFFNA